MGLTKVPNLEIVSRLTRVWSPEDGAQLREDIAAEPIVIGQSVLLDLIVDCEGLR